MPSGNPQQTKQRAFYVAVSRARDRAELVTDDAWKLADQLQKATGERISALDGVAKQAAHEAVFGRDGSVERAGDRTARGHGAADRGLGMARAVVAFASRATGVWCSAFGGGEAVDNRSDRLSLTGGER